MRKERKTLPMRLLKRNDGQLEWLRRNPRQWTKEDVERTARSIAEDPDFLEDRPLLVVPDGDGAFIVFAGNLRREGCIKAKVSEAPCVIYHPDTDDDRATILRRAMKDNGSFGSWDFDTLANEWDDLPLQEWGVPAWNTGKAEASDAMPQTIDDEQEGQIVTDKVTFVEEMLNDAMRRNVHEFLLQYDEMIKNGWVHQSLTEGFVRANFIRAKYYGKRFQQWQTIYFTPERFDTSAKKQSYLEALRAIDAGETNAGIVGLRTLTKDDFLLHLLTHGGYIFASARLPLDFPSCTARALIEEFAGTGAKILDPCHGWGGRLVGAMLADASLYVGVDPSPEAHAGVTRMARAFHDYAKDTNYTLIDGCFESADVSQFGKFDMAITSPPYFDVEKYHGPKQSHILYNTYDSWKEHFYGPLFQRVHDVLKATGVFAINIGSQSYPLLRDGIDIAKKVGFKVEEIRPLGGRTESSLHVTAEEDREKIIILRK